MKLKEKIVIPSLTWDSVKKTWCHNDSSVGIRSLYDRKRKTKPITQSKRIVFDVKKYSCFIRKIYNTAIKMVNNLTSTRSTTSVSTSMWSTTSTSRSTWSMTSQPPHQHHYPHQCDKRYQLKHQRGQQICLQMFAIWQSSLSALLRGSGVNNFFL